MKTEDILDISIFGGCSVIFELLFKDSLDVAFLVDVVSLLLFCVLNTLS